MRITYDMIIIVVFFFIALDPNRDLNNYNNKNKYIRVKDAKGLTCYHNPCSKKKDKKCSCILGGTNSISWKSLPLSQ